MASSLPTQWFSARLALREVLQQEGATFQQILDEQQKLQAIYTGALHQLEEMQQAEQACQGLWDRLTTLSVADTLLVGIGVAGVLAVNTALGESYPWIKTAGVVCIGVAQFFSKTNDVLANKDKKQATQQQALTTIVSEGKPLLEVLKPLTERGGRGRNVDSSDKIKALCLKLLPEPVSETHIDMSSDYDPLLD